MKAGWQGFPVSLCRGGPEKGRDSCSSLTGGMDPRPAQLTLNDKFPELLRSSSSTSLGLDCRERSLLPRERTARASWAHHDLIGSLAMLEAWARWRKQLPVSLSLAHGAPRPRAWTTQTSQNARTLSSCLKTLLSGTEETTQQLRALTALLEVLSLIPSNHMVTQNPL